MATIAKPLLLDETYKEGNAALINILENITTATDKAAEAAASADVATTKASEASTSAATATAKASEANTSATNAAQSYANADAVATQLTEYLATKETLTAPAVDKTLLIEGAAADSKVVGELKSDLAYIKSDTYIVEKTKNLNNRYCVTGNFLIDNSGTIIKHQNIFSVVIPIEPNKVITIDNKTTGDRFALTTTNVFPDDGVPHSGLVELGNGVHYTTPNTAKYLIIYCNQNGAVDISGMRVYYGTEWVEESTTKSDKALYDSSNALSKLSKVFGMLDSISPKQTTFFDINYGSEDNVTFFIGYCDTDGEIVENSSLSSLIINLKPSKTYYIYIPNRNRGNIVSSPNGEFIVGNTYETLEFESPFVYNGSSVYKVTTKEDTKAIMLYFYKGVYDYESNKNKIIVSEDEWNPYARTELKKEYLPTFLSDVNPLDNSKILIFGDSITDCCHLSIADNKTIEYYFRNPSNSYINSEGQTVRYSMWAKILNDSVNVKEIRNYAHYGASFKTSTRESGLERQNLHYQIDVAMNDLDNPNNVFSVDNFVPDIVIFALGTNDGNPNDTYESAMNVAYYKEDGVTLDTDTIIANLSETKFCESARKAFMKIKKAFPLAQIYCVLPIQRADSEGTTQNLHDELKKMADRYGCIIIDGTFDFGITRDFNNWNSIGMYLKDGLHPNDKGQNLMARGIISSLKSHYMPFGKGFNA